MRHPQVCDGRSHDRSEGVWLRIAGNDPDGIDPDGRSLHSNAGWSRQMDVGFAWKPSWECHDSLVWSNGGLGDSSLRKISRAFRRSTSYIEFNEPQAQGYRESQCNPAWIRSAIHAPTPHALTITTLLRGFNLKNINFE